MKGDEGVGVVELTSFRAMALSMPYMTRLSGPPKKGVGMG